nr:ATP-binding protein [Candidatus Sigynarchaeota archaeon]
MAISTPTCSRCTKNRAVMVRAHSGEAVCKACFLKEIEDKVRRTMSRYKMVDSCDKLTFALSGGKDSTVLVRVIAKVHENLLREQVKKGNTPVAITIDEGIANYRDESLRIARDTCAATGIDQILFSFKQEFGMALDDMIKATSNNTFIERIGSKHAGGQLKNAFKVITKPCSICGVLRRRVLNDIAAGLHATKIATGHNLNDEAETFLINLFKGDINRMGRAASILFEEEAAPFVKKIKPLQDLLQQDVVLYLYHAGGDFQETPCPYAGDNVMRGEAQGILYGLEGGHPGTIFNIKKFMDTVYPLLSKPVSSGQLSTCEKCGAPKSKDLDECMACYYIEAICGKDYTSVMRDFIARHGS